MEIHIYCRLKCKLLSMLAWHLPVNPCTRMESFRHSLSRPDSSWLAAMSVLTTGSCWECNSSLINNHCKSQCRTSCHPAPQWLCCGVAAVLGKGSSLPREQPLPLISVQIKWLMAKGTSSWAAAVKKFGWSCWPF